jgi:hypothetical protein
VRRRLKIRDDAPTIFVAAGHTAPLDSNHGSGQNGPSQFKLQGQFHAQCQRSYIASSPTFSNSSNMYMAQSIPVT